jgi:hypothetical protein
MRPAMKSGGLFAIIIVDIARRRLFRFDRIETGLQILDLTRFLDANRFPLRLKTL